MCSTCDSPSSPRVKDIEALLSKHREGGTAPNLAAGVSKYVAGSWRTAIAGETACVFDLASVTKPMTAVSLALSDVPRTRGLGALLPGLASTFAGSQTLETLLAHRSGLEAHISLFLPLLSGEHVDKHAALHAAASARRSDAIEPPFAPVYSDMGYALVGEALAAAHGTVDVGDVIARRVLSQLDLAAIEHQVKSQGQGRLGSSKDFDANQCAPTERVDWRGGLVQGVVHDENAFALTGAGVSGHAGMFGDVAGVLAFGRFVLDGLKGRTKWSSDTFAWLVQPRPGGTLRAGFDAKSPGVGASSAGTVLGPDTFGHLGFTGTSLWIDPAPGAERVTVLLTNRVSPTRDSLKIRAARPEIHDALARAAL
jgi:serine-type D-Ala-D-Ala carboxypeptidase